MNVVRFKRFTRPQVLRGAGRDLLGRLFGRFREELASRGLGLPGREVTDEIYYGALARVLMSPEGLPERLNEVLFAIDEMATPDGQQRLQAAVRQAGIEVALEEESSEMDVALRVWLAAPDLLAAVHNQQRMGRLAAFEYFGAAETGAARGGGVRSAGRWPGGPGQPGGGMGMLAPEELAGLTQSLDDWFARHHLGRCTTRIEQYAMDGELWFLVRHGVAYSRTPKVEQWRSEIIHFRPEKDDVVVYTPVFDELRVNARTRGERQAYREQFGWFLRGRTDYFSERMTHTLEPLRVEGADALDPAGIDGLVKVVLREIEVVRDNGFNEVIRLQADDLFECAAVCHREAVPASGRLSRATFEFHFEGCSRPQPVQVRLPNFVKLGRHCQAPLVNQFLRRRGFRAG
jgi:hypothetical protein